MQAVLNYRGLKVEHTRVTSHAEYDFRWSGQCHYLALHDIVLADGELHVGSQPSIQGRDIRNKMTFVPYDQSFSGWAKTTGRQDSFTVLSIDPARMDDDVREALVGAEPLIYFDDPALLTTLNKLRAVAERPDGYLASYGEGLSLLAALELAQVNRKLSNLDLRTGRLSVLQESLLRDYIEAHLASDITLDELARIASLSRFHLARRFKATFSLPPHKYILQRRIETAKDLLKRSDLPVAEIALVTGFSSSTQLIRTFRTVTGTTPLVYRRSW